MPKSRGRHGRRVRKALKPVERPVPDDYEIQLSAETWEAIRDTPDATGLLNVMETEGVEGAERWLQARGLSYTVTGVL